MKDIGRNASPRGPVKLDFPAKKADSTASASLAPSDIIKTSPRIAKSSTTSSAIWTNETSLEQLDVVNLGASVSGTGTIPVVDSRHAYAASAEILLWEQDVSQLQEKREQSHQPKQQQQKPAHSTVTQQIHQRPFPQQLSEQ